MKYLVCFAVLFCVACGSWSEDDIAPGFNFEF
jgi:hypothetical protein